jgi:hypothetical protein
MLRGFGKLIAIVAAAALAGAAIGIGLAAVTGSDDTPVPVASATSTVTAPVAPAVTQAPLPPPPPPAASTTDTQTAPTATTTTPATPVRGFKVPRVQVLSAAIATLSADGGTPVTVRVRVTNRRGRALTPEDPVLLEGPDAVPLDKDARAEAGAVRKALEPGESAAGALRFTVPSAIAQRIRASGRAQLKIATRTITLKLTVQ